MKLKYYMMGLVALSLCTACNNNDESGNILPGKEEVVFSASLVNTKAVSSRADSPKDPLLQYINGIYIQKDGNESIEYKVRNGNYGTLDPIDASLFLKWSEDERKNNTEVHFYAWTVPTGVTLTLQDGTAKGSIDFSSDNTTGGNRKAKNQATDSPKDTYNNVSVTPLEVFVSSHAAGTFQEKPNVLLPFKHQVCKVYLEIYDDKNFPRTTSATIRFPFIKEKWNITQGKVDNPGDFIYTADPASDPLSLDLNTVDQTGDKALFYLPPMEDDNSFTNIGDFEIIYNGKTYYGSFASLTSRIKELKRGEVMTCRIDLNENYGTGVGVTIKDWVNGGSEEAPANPYQGIYTVDELKVLKSCLDKNTTIPEHLYIEESGKKIIRLYNDLTLAQAEEWSLKLENDMIFDGLGHIVTVPTGKSLFGELTATAGQPIAINNIRLAGTGQLAVSTGTDVTLYNCHANGTGHLVGTAKDGTTFDFCSAEAAANLLAEATSGTITMQNCFVAYNGATAFAGAGGTITAKNSFIFDTTAMTGSYYMENGTTEYAISVDATTGKLVVTTNAGTTPPTTKKLIDLLNDPTSTGTSSNHWVYVYGKDYPVMRIK